MPIYQPPEQELIDKKLENKITEVYNQAAADVTKKWEDYTDSFKRKDAVKKGLVEKGKLSQEDYLKWRKSQVLVGKRWGEMRDALSKDLVNADKLAVSIINEFSPSSYALGINFGTFQVEKGSLIDTSYTLYNREAVERLIRETPSRLMEGKFRLLNITKWELDHPKDKHWNQKQVAGQITQGILQGEDIRQVSKRLQKVVGMDKQAAMRNARTAMTGAQNGGRMDAYRRAETLGIKVEKQWEATMDSHTRDSHIDMDGEHVPVDSVFSNGLMYPGEAGGPPAEVYNCRCTTVPWLPDIDTSKDPELKWRNDEDLGGMSWEEWKKTHAGREPNTGAKKTATFDPDKVEIGGTIRTSDGEVWKKIGIDMFKDNDTGEICTGYDLRVQEEEATRQAAVANLEYPKSEGFMPERGLRVSQEKMTSLLREMNLNQADIDGKMNISIEDVERMVDSVSRYGNGDDCYNMLAAQAPEIYEKFGGISPNLAKRDFYAKQAENVEEFISLADKVDHPVYRGICFNTEVSDEADIKSVIDKLKPGEDMSFGHIASWSSNKYTAKDYAENIIGADWIDGGKNYSVVYSLDEPQSIVSLYGINPEGECLSPKAAQFRIKSVKSWYDEDDNCEYYRVEVEEVTNG